MSLLRTGLVIAVAIALLPADKAGQERAFEQAREVAVYVSTYCEREAAKCEQAAGLWEKAKAKAEVVAVMLVEASEKYAAEAVLANADGPAGEGLTTAPERSAGRLPVADASAVSAQRSSSRTQPLSARGTLTDQDLRPAWRGP